MFIMILIFLAYNYVVFHKISEILVGFKRNPLIFISVSILNLLLLITSYNIEIPYYMSYFSVLILLTIEFLIFSKAKISQAFLCACMIVVNISTIQIVVITIYSYINGITPLELFKTPNLFYNSLTILIIILFTNLVLFSKLICIEDIIKLSTTRNYCLMISSVVVFILFYTIFDVIALQSEHYFHKMAPKFISSSLLTLILFYTLFLYSIKSVKMVVYKRKSDELEIIKIQNSINKKSMEDKILRDDLTSCYNRKFIMSTLEELKQNKIHNFAILFIDVNDLKFVNDTLGHNFGDEYILNVSKAIKEAIRENDLVARIGGDEFLVVLMNLTDNDIPIIIKRLNEKILFMDSITHNHTVSISIGHIFIDQFMIEELEIETIIKIADDKMRIEKKLYKEKRGN